MLKLNYAKSPHESKTSLYYIRKMSEQYAVLSKLRTPTWPLIHQMKLFIHILHTIDISTYRILLL